MLATTHKDLPVLFFATPTAWEKWLAANYSQPQGVWLRLSKKAATVKSLSYDQALDVALCYGWIDGLVNTENADYYLQKFTHRRPKSNWSARNIGRASALLAAGKVQASGMLEIEAAQQDGRWSNP
jgi:uncharacterized protein YdeI (YjbR/CyaY-like superfamily)